MNSRIRRLINIKQRRWQAHRTHGTDQTRSRLKAAQNEVKKIIKKSKFEFEERLSNQSNHNPKPFWAYTKSKTMARTNIGPLEVNNVTITDHQEQANVFNKQYVSVFTRINGPPPPIHNTNDSCLSDVTITPWKVKKVILGLKAGSAPGPDGISPLFLKKTVDIISIPLAHIFNQSLATGEVPQGWRDSNISPIFKAGSKKSPSNYRPVSLTSIISRVFEKIIFQQLQEYMEATEALPPNQHGFRQGKSCVTNLLEFFDKVTKLLDQKQPVDLIYLDFSKPFDKVSHQFLLHKLESIGVSGKLLTWISNWLRDRRQRVGINGKYSDWETVLSGVPQGSVLGVILFLIYIMDISNGSTLIAPHSIISTFADDTKLAQSIHSQQGVDQLQSLLDNLASWSEKWAMPFNASKCTVLHLGYNNNKNSYSINDTSLSPTLCQKDLGVQIHQSLKPASHINYAVNKAQSVMRLIGSTFSYKSKDILIKLYKSHIRCHLEYGSTVWRPWLLKDIEKLERVQRRFIKMIPGVQGSTYEEKLKFLGLPSILARHERSDMIQAYKLINNIDRIDPPLDLSTQSHHYLTRGATSGNLKINYKRLDIRKYFFTERIRTSWNKISAETRSSQSLATFKRLYDGETGN